MKLLGSALMIASLAGTGALAERTVDPFERQPHDFVLEGPQHRSEVFYLSSNWYDEQGNKHDDRTGDVILATTLLSTLGAAALSTQPKQDTEPGHTGIPA